MMDVEFISNFAEMMRLVFIGIIIICGILNGLCCLYRYLKECINRNST